MAASERRRSFGRGRGVRRLGESGQIIVLFAFSLFAILAMLALLFDASEALATRRRLQNSGDAAALAGSHVLQTPGSIRMCSATDNPPGAPRTDIVTAVLASIEANLPGFPQADVVITCPAEWRNQAVRVELRGQGASFFAGPVLGGPIDVATRSTAINGQVTSTVFSVVMLNPWNASWPQARRGCPSVLFSGGPTVQFDGSLQINSACPQANGGALATNGNAATLTMAAGVPISIAGGYSPAALTVNPVPLTGQPVVPDPLRSLDPPSTSGMTVRSNSKLILNNASAVLEPGIYRNGIELRNSSRAFLRPGIYYLDGGGLSVGAQAEVYSVNPGVMSVDSATWSQNCGDTTCGVLVYNAGDQSGANSMDSIATGAGSVLRLRAYDERAVGNAAPEFRNLLIFQARTPAPTTSYAQPPVLLSGGGNVSISGTLYAPGAQVQMGGTSGGSGGGPVNLTLQFIAYDLAIQGNVSFRFYYTSDEFARPADYGLVE